MNAAPPILTCAESQDFESAWFAGDEAREWAAMQQAGRAVAEAILTDFRELGAFPANARVLVLAGKGHNAGDALIAARRLHELHPLARIQVLFVFGERPLRQLAQRAWLDLAPVATRASQPLAGTYDVVLDGVFGYQFRPPLPPEVATVLAAVNALDVRLRAAVDLPSGLDAPEAFQADFTYATGIVKTPLLTLPRAGRIRYLDLGFFNTPPAAVDPKCHLLGDTFPHRVLTPSVLETLRQLRRSGTDKRSYGHLLIVGGSRAYPGAVLMSVLAALRSGVGLVTAFVPESLAPAFAAQAPEAMWVGWPETPEGSLALEGTHLLREKVARATALLIGPGLGREREPLALAKDIVGHSPVPVVIDADALQPDIVDAGTVARILTPHAGEYARIAGALTPSMVIIKKGPTTQVCAGAKTYHSFYGGPVLARGGSGDLLAGLTAGLLAQTPNDEIGAACRGTVWHGLAADALAQTHGQVAVNVTQCLDFLPQVLRL
ncbi:MAG: NAD(P)H-hydrate dehydratase [Opitutus sp.]|nr:NAD(P)H-hydrate dehydratase [Opitutus sp.]MCS6247526.1 NAD(P)H-hydrate dehydratase [Opitutus sp.]MCS6274662.1 NAD(P)H-hydrate dehydratase [Opitutus sp.]MCS6277340.1 NAD(P)H-hydrate dehydratase [Opitutus sp.]MCS6300462.1 NAD(P)H-hydrate dehydratase [Opitutus sp.]